MRGIITFTKNLTLAASLTAFVLTFSAAAFAQGNNDNQKVPVLPCAGLQVPEGHRLARRVSAAGVQIYRWNGVAWSFVAPEANLYANSKFRGLIGTHYAGPTWESNSGSKVVGRRLFGCSPDPDSIAWLLLEATLSDGPGIFNGVSYIQRVNTSGGLAPLTPGSFVGEEARVPYTTDYYFYKPQSSEEEPE